VKKRALLLLGVASMAAVPAIVFAQRSEYPITVIAPGKGPYAFPEGYQTPWDRIEIMVTEKMSPNLFVLHGSQGLDPAHPDASGGRAMALFGPDGVLMVDTENRQVADKTLKAIRSFTSAPIKALVNTHIHPDHTGANAFFAQQGALIFSQNNLRTAPASGRTRRSVQRHESHERSNDDRELRRRDLPDESVAGIWPDDRRRRSQSRSIRAPGEVLNMFSVSGCIL